ncbi:ClpP/crotonase [Laetiporus sulphureus 93-53]|uniref:ClpP/crotonase n=1 Tax=Laetiporus sulphureus 93-53 TaxID=1314785 RepID=A0A165IE88_9APHY|nr:ClpP/crotonase [Laetiporus sulphureus 93-53]KZT12957.1 ClpP/crotonase [Laetiporus sulphureus 93-53]
MAYTLSFPSDRPLVTVTHPTTTAWVIEMHHGEDNRFTEAFVSNALMPALDAVERDWREGWRSARAAKDKEGGKGFLVITGKRNQNKFFSNGLDFDNLAKDPNFPINFFPLVMNPFYRRVLTFPIPTVAAINGHCFAAAMILSLCCDYRVMTDGSSRNAWVCMNEVHFGAGWPLAIAAVVRAKVSDARTHRKIALEGYRFTPQEAVEAGFIDHLVKGDSEAIIAKAMEVGDSASGMARMGAWGVIKRDLYRDVLEASARDILQANVLSEDAAAKAKL